MAMEVYLDNSATTRPCEAAVRAVNESMAEAWHNPSALYRPAMEAEKRITAVRELCLRAAGAEGQQLIFTSCGTEADNLGILGYLRTVRHPGRVLIFSGEHPAVLNCADEIRRLGHTPEFLKPDARGVLDLQDLEARLDSSVRMICVMHVNNETGAVQPLETIVSLRKRLCPDAAVHVDGVQAFLRVPMDFNRLGIDSYVFSGHKIHAVKGIGGLILRKGHPVRPLLLGGGQEGGERSGTENTPGIAALGAAVSAWPGDAAAQMAAQKAWLLARLRDAIPALHLNGPEPGTPESAPHILNVSLPPVRSQTMLFALEGDGILVSAGSACASHKQKVSAVLTGMGIPAQTADCALRISLCPGITEEQLNYTVDRIAAHYAALSRFTRR